MAVEFCYEATFYSAERMPIREGRWKIATSRRHFYTTPGTQAAQCFTKHTVRDMRNKTVRLTGTRDAIRTVEVIG